MEVLTSSKSMALLEYLPSLRLTLADWLFVEVHMHDSFDKSLSIAEIAELLHGLYSKHEGRIYICNPQEILMLINWGKKAEPEKVVKEVRFHLPAGSCDIEIIPSSSKGMAKLELMIMPSKTTPDNLSYVARSKRRENVILIADDDLYMRTVIKGIMSDVGAVSEVTAGDEVNGAYLASNPDVVFLDIHMPKRNGPEVLQDILNADPDAYVIMVSSDSSRKNVETTLQKGAKDFLTKPFTRGRLLECLRKCSTIY
jgi:two-component system, chemotaxis family, chemotaxis protein CheY